MNLCRLQVHMVNCWHQLKSTFEYVRNIFNFSSINHFKTMKLSDIEGFPTEVAVSVENLDSIISVMEESVSELISTPLVDAHSNVGIQQLH